MLFLMSCVPLADLGDSLAKEAVICEFKSAPNWSHVNVSLTKAYGPKFDVSRPSNKDEKEWCKKWKKVDRWRVCRSVKQETDFFTEMKSKAYQKSRYKGVKWLKKIDYAFSHDLYPAFFSANGINCPWMDDTDQGQKKKELYTLSRDLPSIRIFPNDADDRHDAEVVKKFQSLEELELELAIGGWGIDQIFVRGLRAGYGWLLYPLEFAKASGGKVLGLNDSRGAKGTENWLSPLSRYESTGVSWESLVRKIENDMTIMLEELPFDNIFYNY